MIELLDYVLDYDDNFWIVAVINDYVWGYIVYSVDENGNRFNHITNKKYSKNLCSKFKKISSYKSIFKPREFYQKHKSHLSGVWLDYINSLNEIGIDDSSIGIFGSYLIGFDIIKDVDFVIYGEENLYKYYNNNDFIKEKINASYISKKHILYQYEKHKKYYSKECDLLEIIGRNWSGVQISDGVLSTPRFIIPDESVVPNFCDNYEVIRVEVIKSIKSACYPRTATVIYENEEYQMITPLWKYQSFAHRNDVIECLASVDKENKTIFLPSNECYIKYIKKTNNIE